MKKTTTKKEAKGQGSQEQLASFLKNNEKHHYNFEESIKFKVPSGSLLLDYHLNMGLGGGLHRMCGITEGGKSSQSYMFMYNFLNTKGPRPRKGFAAIPEGRLEDEMIERSGIKFVYKAEDWVEGTCFVLESNIYEVVVDALRQLVFKNEENNQYFFVVDSLDGLIRKDDLDKSFEDSQKVAGGAVVGATFLKKCGLALQKRGHIGIFISQVRDTISLDPFTKVPMKITNATGGNAYMHFTNWIFQYEGRYNKDLILKDDRLLPDPQKNPYVGHYAKVVIKKSPNEKTNLLIKYPIKYGKKDGTSNWIEKEIVTILMMWVVEKKGTWLYFHDDFLVDAKEFGVNDMPDKVQGSTKFEELVENNSKAKEFFIDYIYKNILTSDNQVLDATEDTV